MTLLPTIHSTLGFGTPDARQINSSLIPFLIIDDGKNCASAIFGGTACNNLMPLSFFPSHCLFPFLFTFRAYVVKSLDVTLDTVNLRLGFRNSILLRSLNRINGSSSHMFC